MNLFTTCGVLLLTLGQVDGSSPSQPLVDIQAAVDQLSSSKYENRQRATEFLWAAGEAAIPALKRAAQHKNREVRTRAAFVLDNVQYGISYGTPRDILREVERFRHGDPDAKHSALVNLESTNRPRIVLGLIQTETDEGSRQQWWDSLERAIQLSLLSDAEADIEVTLQEAAAQDERWVRHWVAYLVSRGRVDEAIARLSASASGPQDYRRLAYLYRAAGRLSEARQLAEKAPHSPITTESDNESRAVDLAWELLLEQRDWGAAAKQLKDRIANNPETAAKDPELLGFAAAYHRLAGDGSGFSHYTTLLQKIADDAQSAIPQLDPRRHDSEKDLIDRQWYAGKALLLNGRTDEAIRILQRHHAAFAFEVLMHQQRYREAFAVAGVPYPHGFDTAWFEKVILDTGSADDDSRQKLALAMLALRQLYSLGQREQVKEWLSAFQRGVASDAGTIRRRMVADVAVKLGMREMAVELGAVVLEREGSPAMLSVLYPNKQALAAVWWEYFRDHRGRETAAESLARIDRCLMFRRGGFSSADLASLLTEVEARVPSQEPKRSDWWHALGETALLHGDRASAWQYFQNAAVFSSSDALRLGDLYAADQKWTEAAEQYRRAWEFDKFKALPLYLYGQALSKIGRDEEGAKLVQKALTLPLGSDESRRELAAGLKERSYREESLRQFQFLARTGVPGEQDVIEASKQIGNGVYQQNELLGADCWQTMVLCCLRSKWGFGDANGYVQIPFLVHKTRAKGLLKSGRIEEAAAEIWASQAISPASLELPEDLLPHLTKLTNNDVAEQLFSAYFKMLSEHCRDFPACATLHNNLAWLCARNGRELSIALQHAEEAMKLDPENPSYIDTLGEIHFHQGKLAEAITCADRCLKIDPRSKHYRAQFERFSAAKAGGN